MQLCVEEQQLINNSSPRLIEFITRLLAIILQLKVKIQELEHRLNLNSSNSSIPPSKDSFHKRKIPNSRKLTYKKPGGQEGHAETTLIPVENPDVVIEHRPSLLLRLWLYSSNSINRIHRGKTGNRNSSSSNSIYCPPSPFLFLPPLSFNDGRKISPPYHSKNPVWSSYHGICRLSFCLSTYPCQKTDPDPL